MKKVKYVITDPCYILSREQWRQVCLERTNVTKPSWIDDFNKAIVPYLYEITGADAWCDSTGFGDWSNYIVEDEDVEHSGFTADTGTVCVCRMPEPGASKEFDDVLKYASHCVAIFSASENISVEFSKANKHWTVVHIRDNETGQEWNTWNGQRAETTPEEFYKELMSLGE